MLKECCDVHQTNRPTLSDYIDNIHTIYPTGDHIERECECPCRFISRNLCLPCD